MRNVYVPGRREHQFLAVGTVVEKRALAQSVPHVGLRDSSAINFRKSRCTSMFRLFQRYWVETHGYHRNVATRRIVFHPEQERPLVLRP